MRRYEKRGIEAAAGLLALILGAVLAGPAAAATVGFNGKALVGAINTSNAKVLDRGSAGTDPESAFIGAGKFRLRAEIATEDGLSKMVYGFETGSNNFGDKWDFSGDSQDFENRFAYIQAAVPGSDGAVFGRAGLQRTGINHWLWTETAAGVTFHGAGRVNWEGGWYRGNEDDIAAANDDTDLFYAKADFSPALDVKLGGFGVYALDFGGKGSAEKDADQYWLGVTGGVKGPVFVSGDLMYQGGDAGPGGSLDVSAYLANLEVGARLGDARKVFFHALYVSGDDDAADSDQGEFRGIDADVRVGQIFFKDSHSASLDRFVADQPYKLANGLINLAVEAQVQIDPKNSLRAAGRYLASAEDVAVGGGSEDALGYEVDLWYAHQMNDNLVLKLEGAYLFSDDLTQALFADEDDLYLVCAGAVFQF
jgi:hypothetical protein